MMHCLRRNTTITTHRHHHHHYHHHYHHPYIASTPSSASSQCIMNTNTRHHFSASSSLHFHHRHHHSYHTDHHSSMSRHNTNTNTHTNNNTNTCNNNNSSSSSMNNNHNNISTFLNSSSSSLTSTNNNKNHNKSNNNTNRYRTIVHMTTFYKKTLPSQLVAFSSPRGKQIFREALSQGTMDNFFNLSENFQIQSEPAYCGLGTLTMVLNSLHIDPGRNWKGVWRWFSEDMFDCCTSLETIQRNGLTLDQFWCLCKCNGADSILYRPFLQRHAERRKNNRDDVGEILSEVEVEGEEDEDEQRKLQEFRNLVKSATTTTSTRHQSNYYKMSDHDHYDHHHHHAHHEEEAEEKHCGSGTCSNSSSCSTGGSSGSHACGSGDIVNRNTFFIVVNFSRQALDQTGDGHFSVIAGYHEPTDMVLLLETARFKYPSYWVPLRDLWRAMDSVDSTSGQTRGYLVVKAAAENDSLLYTIFLNHKVSWRQFSLLFSTQIVPSIMTHIRPPSSSSSNNDSNIGSGDEGEEIWQLDTIEDLLTLIVTKLPVEIENVLLEYSRTLMFESIMCTHHRNDLPGLLNDLRQTPLFPLVQNAFNRAFELRKKQQQQQQNHEQQQGQQQNDHQNGSSLRMTMDTESSTQCNSREVMQWAANNHHHLHAGEEDQCTIQFRSIFDAPRCHELIVLLLMTCPIDCLSSIVPRHIWTGVHDVYRDLNQSVPSDKLRQEIEKMRKLIQTLCSMKTKPSGNVIATGILSQCSNTKCMNRCHSSTGDEHVTFMNA